MSHPKLNHVQEVEVFYILPAIRRELALAMKLQGIEQKKIAQLLGVTEPAVSQYVNSKRASTLEIPSSIKEQIASAAREIHDLSSMQRETQELLAVMKSERITCQVCQSVSTAPKGCGACVDE